MIYRNLFGRRLTRPIARGSVLAAAGILALAPASANAVTARPMPPATVYVITFSPNSILYRLDPRSHVEIRKGLTGAELTDVTFRGKTLYAISFTDLYWLNTATGASHRIGSLGFTGANALVTQPKTGTLYGADQFGDFFKVNPRTGRATLIGTFGGGLGSAGDLTFAHGHLYAAVSKSGSAESYLATVNPRTGSAKIIGNTGFSNVWGLTTGSGALYGATYGGSFLAISATTGRGKVIWREGIAAAGMAAP